MIDKVIAQQTRKLKLFQELKQSQIYATKTYDYVKHGHYQYSLILIKTGKIICHGPQARINSYINLRKIDTNLIYNWKN